MVQVSLFRTERAACARTRSSTRPGTARADAVLAASAGSLTFGKLRAAAHRLVLELDPESAERRKDAARQDAHVRRFREDSGNAGMVARELPPDEVLASWQHVEQRALDLRAAGVPGTVQELRVRAYLDLLQERDSRLAPYGPSGAGTGATADPDEAGESGSPQHDDGNGVGADGSARGPDGNGGSPDGSGIDRAGGPGGGVSLGPAGRDTGPHLAALVNITIPWSAWTGPARTPADVAGYGLDHTTAWDQGGLTCECDLAPLCRHHHRCKQAEGWRLEQPEPGVLIWRTPAGRSYATGPTQYPA